jgi:peptidoglycan/LPS O-acetylase OafA/YrhL
VGRIEWANSLRGLAAMSVLIGHFAGTFWTHHGVAANLARRPPLYSGVEGMPLFARFLDWLPISLGGFGVTIFFLLSGYVISISLASYSRTGFLIGRLMRLLPTYAAGYLVTCAVIWAVSDPKGELSAINVITGAAPGLSILLGIPAPKDGIVWTLIVEMVFYTFCLAFHLRLASCWKTIAGIAMLCAAAQWLIAPVPLKSSCYGLIYVILLACPFLPVILIGVVLASYRRGVFPALQAKLLFVFLVSMHLILMYTSILVQTPLKFEITSITSLLFFTAIWAIAESWRQNAVSKFLADISYPLYVVHPVLGYALLSVLAANGMLPGVAVLIATAAAILVAWLLHRAIEKPTHRLGRRWARRLSEPVYGAKLAQWHIREHQA